MNSTILFFDALSIRDCQDESNELIGPVAIPIYGKRKTTDCAPQIESILISFVRNRVRFWSRVTLSRQLQVLGNEKRVLLKK